MVSARDLKKRIESQLEGDGRIDASAIKVEVKGSRVTLTGSVPSFRAKRAAEDVSLVGGVSSFANRLAVKYPYEPLPADSEIASIIKNALFWDPDIDSRKIGLSVRDGEVTITGAIDAFWKKVVLQGIAANVIGVTNIVDETAVVPTKDSADEEMARSIVSALERSRRVHPEELVVTVKNGEVRLEGRVPDWRTKRDAYEAAARMPGVRSVNDEISVAAAQS